VRRGGGDGNAGDASDHDIRYDDVMEANLLRVLTARDGGTDAMAQLAGGKLTVTIFGRSCAQQCKDSS
jgi:hypothetical protein